MLNPVRAKPRKIPPAEGALAWLRSFEHAKWLIAALLSVIALLPRTSGLADFYTIDEAYHWVSRVQNFAAALRNHDWAATDQTGHPGVTTMWLGALGRWLGELRGIHNLGGSGAGAAYLAALRLPLAAVNGLAVALGFLLLCRLVRPQVAILAGLLWACSPFIIAHSRLLHLDGLLTSFMTLSLLCLLYALRPTPGVAPDQQPLNRWGLLASAVLGGLALLTKAPSLLLLPTVGLVLFGFSAARGTWKRLRWAAGTFGLWLAVAAVVVFACWPAMWVAPLDAAADVVNEIVNNGGQPTEVGNYFLGQPVPVPGPLFYPAVLLWRTTPLTLLGLLAMLASLIYETIAARRLAKRGDPANAAFSYERPALLAILGFALLFGLAMDAEPKQFDRYLLPIWPSLEILAAAGLVRLYSAAERALASSLAGSKARLIGLSAARTAALALATAMAIVQLAVYHPYYLAYFNPLLGGGASAQQVMLVGWGEGMEQIGAWLRARPDLKRGPVLSWIPPTLAPFVPASPGVLDLRVPLLRKPSSYAVLYSRSVQRKESAVAEAYVRQTAPLQTFSMYGIEYASVYQLPRPFDTPLDALLGEGLHLRGFSQQLTGGTLTITPSWDVQRNQAGGQFCFVHVLAEDGRRVGQVDAPLDQGMFTSWQAGQQFDSPLPLQLAPDLPKGEYQIVLGVYTPGGARLPLRSGPAAPQQLDGPDAILLGTISFP